MAKDKTAKKDKKDKGSKSAKAGRSRDTVARSWGALSGILVVGWAGWQLVTQQTDLLGAGKLALVALVLSIVVEKLVVPFGRAVIGPPNGDQS